MSRLTRTLSATSLAAVVAAAVVAAPSSALAAHGLDRIDLVTGSQPEGIAAGPGTTFFAGARSDGAIYVGDVVTGEREELVAGDGDGPAVGLLYDERSGLLWVAGGSGGDVTAYDAETGEQVFRALVAGAGFLNDVAITDRAIYVTDSFNAEIVVIPLRTKDRDLPVEGTYRTLKVKGEYVQPEGFGLNGIRELPSGDLVVVSGGVLYAVDERSGQADVIEQDGQALVAGDGLVLEGRTLYVVNGAGGDEVVELRLAADEGSTTFVRELTDPELDRPTTGALIDGALYVVNGRFAVAGDPQTENYVTRLDL